MARLPVMKILAGVAGVAAAGAAWLYLKERSVETPPFEPVEGDGAFELRHYPALAVAETVQAGARDRALGNGFGLLADYIFAEGREGDEIAMTAPVNATRLDAGHWRIRFFMPRAIDPATLPQPGPGIAIGEVHARRIAVIRFGGKADDSALAARERELREWLDKRGLQVSGEAEHNFYNSPMMPGPLRQNEIWIPLS